MNPSRKYTLEEYTISNIRRVTLYTAKKATVHLKCVWDDAPGSSKINATEKQEVLVRPDELVKTLAVRISG